MSHRDADVLVIGGGPAGASVGIRLARAGWQVAILEQSGYPRPKVCGGCLSSASLCQLDDLGVGEPLLDLAGPEIRRLAWTAHRRTATAGMPPCDSGPHRYGRAIGRDLLDAMLLDRARDLGVRILQPARAQRLSGTCGEFVCEYHVRTTDEHRPRAKVAKISAAIVVDAHGSWERAPAYHELGQRDRRTPPAERGNLLAFRATFSDTSLPAGLLSLLSLPGGYGGMVVSDHGRTTVACCIRRDILRECRLPAPGTTAGAAVERLLRTLWNDLAIALRDTSLDGGWQSIGPLRPGFHPRSPLGMFAVGNAAAEAHPVIGEGICMALESAAMLAIALGHRPSSVTACSTGVAQGKHMRMMRAAFARRLMLAQLYSHLAMRGRVATAATMLMRAFPRTLTLAAQLAGKAHGAALLAVW